ncbi:MAG: hypothetical protein P4L11_00140 [Geothrix sp.]|nr:hypothetical protein [Geothrix sp.]
MHFPEAFSHQLPGMINVDKAVRYFDAGHLTDRNAFECPDTHCSAPLILKALPVNTAGQGPVTGKCDPYFSTSGDKSSHDPACEFLRAEIIGPTFIRTRPNWKDDLKNINLDDVFDLMRPTIVRPQIAGSGSSSSSSAAHRSVIAVQKAQRKNLSHYSVLESVVDRYLGLPARLAAKKCLRIAGRRLTYTDTFIEMKDIGPKGLGPNDIRIYTGEALLKPNPKVGGGYGFYLLDDTSIAGVIHRGAYKIWASFLQPKPGSALGPGITRMARRLSNAIGTVNNGKVKVRLYILGGYKISSQHINGAQQEWLNFQVANLDHVHFEII